MQFLLILLLKITLVALIGRLAIAAMPRASASTRYLVAVTTLCSMLVVPLAGISGYEWRLPLLPARTQKTVVVETTEPQSDVTQTFLPAPQNTDTSVRVTFPRPAIAVIAAIAIAALFLVRMLFGIAGVLWITRRAAEVRDEWLIRDFDHAAEQLGVTRCVRLLSSDRVSVPIMWGIVRPALLLPTDALQWSRERLQVVFLHELAHLRRSDTLTLLIIRATTAMYWFHPLAWSLERIARRECEQACDDLVLATGTRPSEYADHLLSIAADLPRHEPFASVTLAMSRRSQLEGRLLSILQSDARRGFVSRRMAVAAGVLAALLVVPIATVRLTAQTTTERDPSVLQTIKENIRHEVASTVTHTVSSLVASLNENKQTPRTERSESKVELVSDRSDKYSDQYDALRARGSKNAEEWAKVGAKLLNNRDLPRAVTALSESIRLDPFMGTAWYNLGCAYALSGDTNKALDTVEQSLLHGFSGDGDKLLEDSDLDSIHSTRLDELAKLADELALRGDGDGWSETIAHYENVTRLHPNIARAWFNLGFAQVEGGQERASIQSFQRVLGMGYRPGTAMYNIGCAYSLLGDRQSSVSWLMKSAAAGFNVGNYAKNDKDLENVRDDSWVEAQIEAAERGKEQ